MATCSDEVRVANVSFAPGASHLKLQLRLQDDRKSFFRLSSEKLERVRYRLQLLASASSRSSNGSKAKKKHKKKHSSKNGTSGGAAPSVAVKFLDADGLEINAKVATVGDALMRTKSLQIGSELRGAAQPAACYGAQSAGARDGWDPCYSITRDGVLHRRRVFVALVPSPARAAADQ